MSIRAACLVAISAFFIPFGAGAQGVPSDQIAGCLSGEKIDGSSVESAKKKMEMAGFSQIRGLKKGCDNFWHATSVREGDTINIVLSPQGLVRVEGK